MPLIGPHADDRRDSEKVTRQMGPGQARQGQGQPINPPRALRRSQTRSFRGATGLVNFGGNDKGGHGTGDLGKDRGKETGLSMNSSRHLERRIADEQKTSLAQGKQRNHYWGVHLR